MKIHIHYLVLSLVIIISLIVCPPVMAADPAPYAQEVTDIMAPLRYSGIHNILDQNSRLSVDFNSRKWTLHDRFGYNDDGSDILVNGTDGLCVRLSRYVYQMIKDILPKSRYGIYFAKVQEKNYFFTPQATHIILVVEDKETSRQYLIDPSFKRYGPVEQFDQYIFFEKQDPEMFIHSNKSSDKFFQVDSATPLFIREDYLIIFSVESIDGRIDPRHFVLSISAVKSQATSGEYVFGLRCVDGYIQTYSNEALMRRLLKPDEISGLQQRLLQWSVMIAQQ